MVLVHILTTNAKVALPPALRAQFIFDVRSPGLRPGLLSAAPSALLTEARSQLFNPISDEDVGVPANLRISI